MHPSALSVHLQRQCIQVLRLQLTLLHLRPKI
jgi:hypothetical protein